MIWQVWMLQEKLQFCTSWSLEKWSLLFLQLVSSCYTSRLYILINNWPVQQSIICLVVMCNHVCNTLGTHTLHSVSLKITSEISPDLVWKCCDLPARSWVALGIHKVEEVQTSKYIVAPSTFAAHFHDETFVQDSLTLSLKLYSKFCLSQILLNVRGGVGVVDYDISIMHLSCITMVSSMCDLQAWPCELWSKIVSVS